MAQQQQDNDVLAIRVTDVSSSQEWTTDPDMIEVRVHRGFLEKAERAVAFLRENDAHKVTVWFALGYDFFENIENLADESEMEGKATVDGEDGIKYVEFEPEYRVDGCHAEIDYDGDIRAVFPFKHSDDNLWCAVGNLDELKAKMGMAVASAWRNNSVQFPRLLSEISATQDKLDLGALAESMDMSVDEVNELFDRAQEEWEKVKASTLGNLPVTPRP